MGVIGWRREHRKRVVEGIVGVGQETGIDMGREGWQDKKRLDGWSGGGVVVVL